jgi:hypothetical protein
MRACRSCTDKRAVHAGKELNAVMPTSELPIGVHIDISDSDAKQSGFFIVETCRCIAAFVQSADSCRDEMHMLCNMNSSTSFFIPS